MRRCEDEKMFYRPPLLEEPCAQTLSGKNINFQLLAALDNCVHMAFLLPCSCCKLLGCYFGCCCSAAQSKEWFLASGRTTPKLKVTHYQVPLAPDFADTFHGAQGSTAEPGVIPDLCAVDPLEWCPAMVIHGA
jgi:hypothetical protein